jgi:2-polyprenyl-3-methyl-5-hydroxy-6-metoxy-1,4-benzoquinol methylase
MQQEGFRVTREFELEHWWFRSRRELIRSQLQHAANLRAPSARKLRLLDFGCGTGFNLSLLADFGEVHGADRFRPQDTQYRLEHDFPLIEVERDLPNYAGHFDIVTALDVLEHLDDDVVGLRCLKELLMPGGQLVLTVPAYRWLWSGEDVISEHRRRYLKRELVARCEKAGLQVDFASYFNLTILPVMTSVIWARRLLAAGGPPQSSLTLPARWLNNALYSLTAHEAALVGRRGVTMPAGASIVCRATRPMADVAGSA